MKKISYIILILSFCQICFGQETYVNNKSAYYDNPNTENINSRSINEITLNANKTFEFWSRPHVSCFTWKSYKGTWKKNKNVIVFYDQYEIRENDIHLTYKNEEFQNFILLKFRTDKNSHLNTKAIKIQFVYDFDKQIKDTAKEYIIDINNTLKIPYAEIPNINDLSAIRIEYYLDKNKKRFDYITTNNPINKKTESIPNVVDVVFVENPKKEIVLREITGKIINKELEIVSISKTKTKLIDYTKEIVFEKNYQLYNK